VSNVSRFRPAKIGAQLRECRQRGDGTDRPGHAIQDQSAEEGEGQLPEMAGRVMAGQLPIRIRQYVGNDVGIPNFVGRPQPDTGQGIMTVRARRRGLEMDDAGWT